MFHSNPNTNMYFSHLKERLNLENSTWTRSISRYWNCSHRRKFRFYIFLRQPSLSMYFFTPRSTEDDRHSRERIGDDRKACLSLETAEVAGSLLVHIQVVGLTLVQILVAGSILVHLCLHLGGRFNFAETEVESFLQSRPPNSIHSGSVVGSLYR